jgi:hypothetical protein
MKEKTCEGEQIKGNTKWEGAQDKLSQAQSLRSEKEWMLKVVKK